VSYPGGVRTRIVLSSLRTADLSTSLFTVPVGGCAIAADEMSKTAAKLTNKRVVAHLK